MGESYTMVNHNPAIQLRSIPSLGQNAIKSNNLRRWGEGLLPTGTQPNQTAYASILKMALALKIKAAQNGESTYG